ncbi:Rab11 family-interacting protein 4A [Habropoda laboriosa]|uniref:Rab11 family-interacting protein 4A n=1 Tax=Habropoda laboriosa TaxID=597456 RepID=A0A0L7QNF2_9HYME|nr:Rab11 family-interacting protein 4A [Habropoda laboriosa]
MVSSRSPGVNVSPANSVATSRVVVSDSDVARDGDAILPSTRQSYRAEDKGSCVNGAPGAVEWSQSGPPSLSMSVDLHHLVNPNLQDSGHYSASPEHADAAASPCNKKPTKSHDEEESYEAFGSVEGDADDGVDSPGGSSSAPSPTGTNSLKNPRSPNSTIGRHSWLRTSLRRTPPFSGRKRLSSNALASQLYRSGSFNSSGRGSNCDPADDMYSDISLEDDVIDLNHRVNAIARFVMLRIARCSSSDMFIAGLVVLIMQVHALQKYDRCTQIIKLEEAAKDAEARTEERLQAEQRRHREWVSRLERERQLQLENYAIKLQAIEVEGTNLRDEIGRLREQLEKVRAEKSRLENDLEEARREVETVREGERQAISRANETHYQLEAAREELSMRVEDQQRIEELMQQVAQLRAHNKSLEESRDELQAAAALQAGRELLMLNPCNNVTEKGPSLAVELLAGMNQDQMDGQIPGESGEPCSISEMKQALKEQQEVNTQLRAYIDGILLNIVENYPQLLEVKQTH